MACCKVHAYFVWSDAAQCDESLELVELFVPGIGQLSLVRGAIVVEHAPVSDVFDETLAEALEVGQVAHAADFVPALVGKPA